MLLEEDFTDSENVFRGFLDECYKAREDCTLTTLASSKEELEGRLISFVANLRDEPLSVYVNNTVYGLLDYQTVWHGGIFQSLYSPSRWYELAERLAAMLNGNGTDVFLAYHEELFDPEASEGGLFVTNNDGLSGSKYWPDDLTFLLDKLLPYFNTSRFADNHFEFYFSKAGWNIPKTHNFVPRRGVKTAHPLLILSTTYDPICPLVSARDVANAFEGSRLVELLGYGHCSIAMPSMCIARHVRSFLHNGTLPESGAKCEVDSPYFVKPKESRASTATVQFADAEEQRIHLAQVELARGHWFSK